MEKNVTSQEEITKLLNEAIECCAEVEVGEAASCVFQLFEKLDQSEFYHDFVKVLNPDQYGDFHDFLMSIVVSIACTLVSQFKNREPKITAKA